MGLATKALQLPKLPPMKLKIRVTLSFPTNKVFVKVSKRSVVDMPFKPTSKVAGPSRTSRSPPRTKTLWSTKSSAIYWYQYGDLGCDDEYIGETSRTFGERYKEHLKAPQLFITTSAKQAGGREGHNLATNIKEYIYIRVNNPTLNNNIGKFNLSHIWDRVLLNTKGLTLNRQGNNNNY